MKLQLKMNLLHALFLLFSTVNTVTTVTAAKQSLRAQSSRSTSVAFSMVCHLTMECLSTADAGQIHHYNECSPVVDGKVSDYSYPIDLPQDFVDQNKDQLMAGKLFVDIPGAQIVNGAVVYPFSVKITIAPAPESFANRRRLASATGTRSVLVLRISSNDATPGYSASQIYNYMFDTSQPDSQPSLKSQYSRLSFGKLNFVPTQYGVMEVPVSMNANGASSATIRDAAITYVTSRYGVTSMTDLADHVVFCIPPGTGEWAGSSPVQSWRIVMNNQWCGYLSGIMHEMGHNLGLLHSNQNNLAYMDFTSYMSAGYATPYYPIKSFNGANNAQLGWYTDRQVTVNPSQGGQMVTLAALPDYGKYNKNNPVLAQVGSAIYLQYNRAKDFNAQAQQMIDQVTIVQQLSNGTSLLGGVDPATNPQYTIVNLDGTGRNVVVYACSRGTGDSNNPDYMTVSIGYDRSYCSQSTASQPVAMPTTKPRRRRPTVSPARM